MTTPVLVALGAFAVSAALTAVVLRYALARSILDTPNDRSSHAVPTPRGGGLAIAVAVLGGIGALWLLRAVPPTTAIAVGGGAALVTLIGWIDDHGHVPARWRAAVHAAAGVWTLAWLRGLPTLEVGNGQLPLGLLGSVLGVLGVVWLINLYNFMDGIDGIAAGQAVGAGAGGAILLFLGGRPDLGGLALVTAAAAGGFLLWNWSPARIFMGDVGSGLLGYLFAALALVSERSGALPLLAWVLLLGVFVFDSTVTLLRRVARGERFYDAHRSHAYQRAVQAGYSHAQVTSAVLALNAVLFALAAAAYLRPALLVPIFLLATAMLALIYRGIGRIAPLPSLE